MDFIPEEQLRKLPSKYTGKNETSQQMTYEEEKGRYSIELKQGFDINMVE
jgi:hypothetical protein